MRDVIYLVVESGVMGSFTNCRAVSESEAAESECALSHFFF